MGMDPATWAAIIGAASAATGAVTSYNAGQQASANQKTAQAEARAAATKQEQLADEAKNRANQKKPDIAALITSAQNMGLGSQTMLSGGASPSTTLGRATLLGG